ncbi:MAG TPA: CrcB family protein [Nocardioidaceae bacterium]|nr:CrcB family protein [Nocardioidaceae bacterium]
MHDNQRGPLEDRAPVDPDVDLRSRRQRRELRRHGIEVLAAIAAGGMLGAAGRYAIDVAMPTSAGAFPWGIWVVNTTGCLLIGVLMVLVVDVGSVHRLVRPFLGVGVLGGYTTFSTAAVDTQTLIVAGHPGLALAYLFGTAAAALAAVTVGVALTRAVALPRPRTRR